MSEKDTSIAEEPETKFKWKTTDGKWHETMVEGRQAIFDFIEWLETDPSVVVWE